MSCQNENMQSRARVALVIFREHWKKEKQRPCMFRFACLLVRFKFYTPDTTSVPLDNLVDRSVHSFKEH